MARALLATTLLALAMTACGGGTKGTDAGADAMAGDTAGEGTTDSGDVPVAVDPGPMHTVTSATPLVATAILADSHPGFGKADCSACHVISHGGTRPPDCVACHGTNGAPTRPLLHDGTGCAGCHHHPHPEMAPPFEVPDDCVSCHRFPASPVCPGVETFDAVVVGAGGGGLGAAATLARAGMKVALVERHNKVGGYMTNFRRGDYRFEISLHAMGGFDPGYDSARAMFTELGVMDRLTPVKAAAMYRTYYPGGVTFETPDGVDAYRDRLVERFPAEADGITRLFADVREMTAVLDAWMAGSDTFNAYMKDHPEAVGRFMEWAYGRLGDAVRAYVTDPQLFAIFTQLSSYVGVEPENLSALYYFMMWNSYHLGGFYNFVGGSQSVSDALAGALEEAGGRIFLDTKATAFGVQDGRVVEVRTEGGPCLRADWFVSNVNGPQTVDLVGRANLPADYVARVDGMVPGWPLVVVYLGVDKDYTPEFAGVHEIIVQDTWDTTAAFDSIRECDPSKSILLVANYSVLDATAAPAGKNVISITGTIGDTCNDHWKRDNRTAFKEYKDVVAGAFIDRTATYLPGLQDHVEVYEVAAPQTLEAFTLNPKGTIYGWHQTPDQSLLERLPQETPLPNLFLAGAWTFPGCGQSSVINSGVMAANKILKAATPAK